MNKLRRKTLQKIFDQLTDLREEIEAVKDEEDESREIKQTMDGSNALLEQDNVMDIPLKSSDLSRYDEVLYD